MAVIFGIDLYLPLGVAGAVPYIAVILISLWLEDFRYTLFFAVMCSVLTLAGFYLSPAGGEFWKVVANRALALFTIWVTAMLVIRWEASRRQLARTKLHAEIEAEKREIYLATIHGAQHILNNLLNQLHLVRLEIENHPEFDRETRVLFDGMMREADGLLKKLSSVRHIDAAEIERSVHSKLEPGGRADPGDIQKTER